MIIIITELLAGREVKTGRNCDIMTEMRQKLCLPRAGQWKVVLLDVLFLPQ